MTGSVPTITLCPMSQSSATTICQVASPSIRVRQQGPRKPTAAVVVVAGLAAWRHLQLINRVWRERRLLASLDDKALKDIGLNRADVEREAGRSPLDLPVRRHGPM